MAIGIIGRKCGMTRVFTEEGESIPVTVIEAGSIGATNVFASSSQTITGNGTLELVVSGDGNQIHALDHRAEPVPGWPVTVAASGRVKAVNASGSGPGGLAECVEASVRRWRFPKPDGGSVTVAFPFIFTPSG